MRSKRRHLETPIPPMTDSKSARHTRNLLLNDFLTDLRYAARALLAVPGFTISAIVTLALGIGATTAIFSAVDGVLLKPLPFSQPDRVVSVFQDDRKKNVPHDDVAPGNFADWRARNQSFAGLAAAEPFALPYNGPDGEEQIYNWNVTQDFFSILDARPALGRLFQPSDFTPGPPHVLVLTYASWQRRFGGDSAIVGKRLPIGLDGATIVGVLPPTFAYLQSYKMELYAPKVLDTGEVLLRRPAWFHVVGRLKPTVTAAQASADMNRVAAQLSAEYPATNTQVGATLEPLRDTIVGDTSRALLLLFGAVGMVLLIACANVANLLLVRTARRSREFAIRGALGAGRGRVLRQMLTESLMIATGGGAAGVLLAFWGVRTIRALAPSSVPRIAEMRVDGRALAFTILAVIITTFVFGILPALRAARPNASDELRAGGRAMGGERQHRLRGLFITAELAFATVLLVSSGLLVRSFVSVVGADRGYRSDHVLAATVFVYQWNRTPGTRRDFIAQLVERASAIPGVTAAGATSALPLEMAIGAENGPFTIPGRPVAAGAEPSARMTTLTPGAFDALGIALRRGRLFSARDDSASVPVAIVSEEMARRYWPGEDAVGKHVTVGFYSAKQDREIVGVVADVRQVALDAPVQPTLYVPHAQAPTGAVSIVLRAAVDPRTIARDLKRAIAALNPALPIADLITLDELVSTALTPRRFTLMLFLAFSLAAIALAVVGVYGVISQGVAERRREFGVRIALGAQSGEVVRIAMVQGMGAAVAGIALGVVGAASISSLLRGMLFSVVPLDAPTYLAVGTLMFGTAALACYVPARRATRINPLHALRAD
jgi:putative ABC transport system permease protein